LAGGAGISKEGGGWGTMGGFLIAPAPGQNSSPITDDILLGFTNAHVISGASKVCNPPMFTGGTCTQVGLEKGTSCCTGPTHTQDVGAFTVDYTRTNVICGVFDNVPTSATSAVSILSVTGIGTASAGDAVIKYGMRTHKTAGSWISLTSGTFSLDFRIRGAGLPAFPEQPTTVTPAGTPPTGGGPGQINPMNENNFIGTAVRDDWTSQFCIFFEDFRSTASPRAKYNVTDCQTIFAQLWAATPNHIVNIFATGGDSGSWVTKGTEVVGLIANQNWQETGARDVTIMGRAWGYMNCDGLGYNFNTALASMNVILRAAGISSGATLCTETIRSMPAPADCSSALNTDQASCKWPRQCALAGTNSAGASCAARSAFGV